MKTIKQIADEIGVSKQAVFYRIKRPPLSNAVQSLTTKLDGILMVDFDGEILIKQAFLENTVKEFGDKEPSKESNNFDGDVIKLLRENICLLQEQLAIKDRQIEALTDTVKTQAQSINADRHNELAGTVMDSQKQLVDGGDAPPTSRWARAWHAWKGR